MTKLQFAALAVGASVATPAMAQEAVEFAGPRAELTVGLDQLRFDLSQTDPGARKLNDLSYGFALGYDAAVSPSVIAGVDVGLNLSDIGYTTGDASNGSDFRKRRELTLAARVGTVVTPNTLIYGKIGYANLQIRQSETVADSTVDTVSELDGFLLGAGVAVKMSPTTYWKSEYQYVDYSSGLTSNKVVTGVGFRF